MQSIMGFPLSANRERRAKLRPVVLRSCVRSPGWDRGYPNLCGLHVNGPPRCSARAPLGTCMPLVCHLYRACALLVGGNLEHEIAQIFFCLGPELIRIGPDLGLDS